MNMNKIFQYSIIGIVLAFVMVIWSEGYLIGAALVFLALMICVGIILQSIQRLSNGLKKLNRRLDDLESQKAAELSGEALDEADNTEINDIQNKEESDTTNVSPCEEQ